MPEKSPKALLEALLFASPSPLEPDVLARVSGLPESEVNEIIVALSAEYERDGRGFGLDEVAGGWQLRSRAEYSGEVAKLRQARPKSRFSRSAMETLAIIAYRQPIQRVEIEQVRGVDCGATLKSLMAQGMVKVIGRKEAPGRPILYGTTNEFLQYFSLRDLESLPTLEEVNELDEGMEPPAPIVGGVSPETTTPGTAGAPASGPACGDPAIKGADVLEKLEAEMIEEEGGVDDGDREGD